MNLENLQAGTRPDISGKVIMTGAEGFDGYEITEYHDMGQDCAMGCKQISGGELTSYSALGNESRQRAIDHMLRMAHSQGANGVINVNFDLTGATQGATQVEVHGTAVKIKPIIGYVPTGAVGNILYEMQQKMPKEK